jgi:hypothetical protein
VPYSDAAKAFLQEVLKMEDEDELLDEVMHLRGLITQLLKRVGRLEREVDFAEDDDEDDAA